MGIYVFNRDTLIDCLEKTDYLDFGKEIFPASVRAKRVMVHLFDGYWEDIGTIKAFYDANLSLASQTPPFDFHSPSAPIYSRPRFLPPTRVSDAIVKNSLVADGCHIGRGCTIENSVIGLRSIIGDNVTIKSTVIMGADYFDDEDRQALHKGQPPLGIGSGSHIEGAILDKNCRIGKNVRIINEQKLETRGEEEACIIREGIPNVVKDGVLPDGYKL
jgi:glucose-1-phosphate adenylyltransferase